MREQFGDYVQRFDLVEKRTKLSPLPMKAAIYPGQGKPIMVETLPDPQPGPDDVMIKVSRCGICGTDLSFTRGAMFDFGENVQFGHEYAGEIVELGKNVRQFKLGDRIAVLPSVACGQCHSCRTHENNVLCTPMPGGAMHGFAELARVPVSVATKLPPRSRSPTAH